MSYNNTNAKQPDCSYLHRRMPAPTHQNQLQFMPGTTQHYPSFIVEVAYQNESPECLINDANQKYFTAATSVQAWLGVKIFHSAIPAHRQFWALWGVRSLFGVGMVHRETMVDVNGFESLLDVEGASVAGFFTIPARHIYHPHNVPQGVPDLVIPFEMIRQAIHQGYTGM